jgi:uncharacterized protein (TIGR02099 family)
MDRRQRRWWTRGITWLSLLAITLALVSAAFQVAVWVAPGYRAQVAQLASQALGQPVRVQRLTLAWRWLWPLLELDDVQVLDAATQQPVLDIGRVRLGFALVELLHGDWVPAEVNVADLALEVDIDTDGLAHLRGFAGGQTPPSLREVLHQLRRFSRIRIERLALSVADARVAAPAATVLLRQGDLRLTDQGFEWRSDWQAAGVLAERLRLNAGVTGPLEDPAQWLLRWTIDASGLQPGAALQARWPWLQPLRFERARAQAAGEWRAGTLGDSDLSFSSRAVRRLGAQPAQLADVDIGLHVRPTLQGGSLELAPLRLTGLRGAWPAGTARLQWQGPLTQAQFQLNADHLRLDDLGRWLAPYVPSSLKLPHGLLSSLTGNVDGLDLRWQPPAPAGEGTDGGVARPLRLAYQAAFRALGAGGVGEPGLTALDGRIDGDEQGGRLQVQGHESRLTLPQVWAAPVPLEQLMVDARWQRDEGRWQLTLPAFTVGVLGAHLQGHAELHDVLDEARVLQLESNLSAGDVEALKPLMPLHWGESLRQWLERALLRGRVSNGRLEIDGPLRDFPFHQRPSGHWGLDFRISNARLDYHHDWPVADPMEASLYFAGNGMGFEVRRSVISGIEITGVTGGIEDFSQSPLLLDGRTRAAATRYYEFLRASPLAGRLAGLTEHSRIDGDADVAVHLEIPLHSGTGQKTVASGTVAVQGVTLQHDALDMPVTDITGTLQFGGGHGVAAEGLTARFYDTPVQARIAANSEGSDELGADVAVDYQQPQGIAARYLPGWLRERLQGRSQWHLRLPLAGAQAGHVQVASDLTGTAVQLPPPLGKSAATPMPTNVSVIGDGAAALRVAVQVVDRLGTQLRFTRDDTGLHLRGVGVRLGSNSLPPAEENGVRVTGALDEAPLAQWIDLISRLHAGGRPPVGASGPEETQPLAYLGTSISVQSLQIGGYQWPPVNLVAAPADGGAVEIGVSGSGNQGTVRVAGDGGSVRGAFEQLTLQAQPEIHDDHAAPADKASAVPPLSPDRLPSLQLAVKALQIGGRPFGQLQFATERVAGGQKLATARLEGGIARVEAEGEWRRQQGLTSARARFDLASDDLAGTLAALGFAETVSGRNAHITGDLVWPGADGGFNWADAQGPVGLSAEHGALRNVEPGGASRVLGLFNFFVLPRRLLLDFRDVVSKGMSFDQIEGHFRLADGVAQTDDLAVRNPAFKIAVRGKIGLAARDIDQTITVTPNTSTLSLGALLAGGSAVALVGPFAPLVAVIANQVLDKPIAQATQLTYRLTGSWDNPEIRKLDGSPVNASAGAAAGVEAPTAPTPLPPSPQEVPP